MIVFWKHRLIYLAVPKTGTTAAEETLKPHADIHYKNPPHLKHITAGAMRSNRKLLSPADPGEFEQVAVMREPLDWLGSWFRYRSRGHLIGKPNSTADLNFNEFVEAVLSPDPPPFGQIGSQFRFLCGNSERPIADRIYPWPAIDQMFAYFERRLNVSLTVAETNRSPRRVLDLDGGLLKQLMEKREAEFALYDQVASGLLCRD